MRIILGISRSPFHGSLEMTINGGSDDESNCLDKNEELIRIKT